MSEEDLSAAEEGRASSSELAERLTKQGWYLGEMTNDAADYILKSKAQHNTFLVYASSESNALTISTCYQLEVDGEQEVIVDHVQIHRTEEGKYTLSGQEEELEDVVDLINQYVLTKEPPLRPALGKSFETQISIPEEPPEYSAANKALKPDIVPLPNISSVKVEKPKEAQAGDLSPESSSRPQLRTFRSVSIDAPSYTSRSPWRRYSNHSPCHPKNCCYACWYRPKYWTGYSMRPERSWYNPRGSGCLRILALMVFWLLCGLCFGCYKCWAFCCQLCFFICCYEDS